MSTTKAGKAEILMNVRNEACVQEGRARAGGVRRGALAVQAVKTLTIGHKAFVPHVLFGAAEVQHVFSNSTLYSPECIVVPPWEACCWVGIDLLISFQ